MITINLIKDFFETKNIFEKYNTLFGTNCFCMAAKDNEDTLCLCLFKYSDDSVIIKDIQPRNDIMMADGILRSTFFVASNRGIEKAYYDNIEIEEMLDKLGFILNKKEKSLMLKKIFESCCGCSGQNN